MAVAFSRRSGCFVCVDASDGVPPLLPLPDASPFAVAGAGAAVAAAVPSQRGRSAGDTAALAADTPASGCASAGDDTASGPPCSTPGNRQGCSFHTAHNFHNHDKHASRAVLQQVCRWTNKRLRTCRDQGTGMPTASAIVTAPSLQQRR